MTKRERLTPAADILPYVVVPNGMKRPKLIREALLRETDMSPGEAEEFIARLHGFMGWGAMKNASEDERRIKGPFDEHVDARTFNDRVEIQAEIATAFGFRDENVGMAVIELIAPTAKDGKPSLRRLQSKLSGQMFPTSKRDLDDYMGRIMDTLGIKGDPAALMDMMRTRMPLVSAPMIDLLEQFGWDIIDADTSASKDGSLVGKAIREDGSAVDIYMSVVTYVIGDRGDEHVEHLMNSIARKNRPAVLLFSRGRVYPMPDKKGVLYGGRAFDGSDWWDFAIRPGHGIDDAWVQKGKLTSPLSKTFAGEHGYDGAMLHAGELDAAAQGLEASAAEEFTLIGSDDGWKSPIFGETAEAFEQMKKSRKGFPGI